MLARQVALYTMGESSSLPEYDAHRLLVSACYVLGVDARDPDPAAMQAVVCEGVETAFDRKLHRIEEEAAHTESLWREVCLTTPLLESIALCDTLESLRSFSACYEPRFFAHEIPADIDYPLCHPVSKTVLGVSYVTKYLETLLIENRFLQCFDLERCKALLHAIHPEYGELLLNLFEPIAVNALGCALVEGKVSALFVDDDARQCIAKQLADASPKRIQSQLCKAAELTCDQLGLRGEQAASLRTYLRQTAINLTSRLRHALNHQTLESVFIPVATQDLV